MHLFIWFYISFLIIIKEIGLKENELHAYVTQGIIYKHLGKDFDGDIKKADLKMRHPYNTYVQEGLPPSHIGLVSLESLNASFHPDDSSSLYFVSKGNGYHKF